MGTWVCHSVTVSQCDSVTSQLVVFRYEEWSSQSGCEAETDQLRNKVNRSQSLCDSTSKISFLIPPDPRYTTTFITFLTFLTTPPSDLLTPPLQEVQFSQQ